MYSYHIETTQQQQETKMKTLLNRADKTHEFLTIVFSTRDEAVKNLDWSANEFPAKVSLAVDGADGWAVKTSAKYFKEFLKLAF